VGPPDKIAALSGATSGTRSVTDRQGRPVMLFESEWALDYVKRTHPDVEFFAVHTP
jgi:peptide subunit release factor RF-3